MLVAPSHPTTKLASTHRLLSPVNDRKTQSAPGCLAVDLNSKVNADRWNTTDFIAQPSLQLWLIEGIVWSPAQRKGVERYRNEELVVDHSPKSTAYIAPYVKASDQGSPIAWKARITSWSRATARGNGKISLDLSNTATFHPRAPSKPASVAPTGPHPTIAMSYVSRSGEAELKVILNSSRCSKVSMRAVYSSATLNPFLLRLEIPALPPEPPEQPRRANW